METTPIWASHVGERQVYTLRIYYLVITLLKSQTCGVGESDGGEMGTTVDEQQ